MKEVKGRGFASIGNLILRKFGTTAMIFVLHSEEFSSSLKEIMLLCYV